MYSADTSVLEMTLAAMLLYRPTEESEWCEMVDRLGYEGVLSELAGLPADSDIFKRVIELSEKGNLFASR